MNDLLSIIGGPFWLLLWVLAGLAFVVMASDAAATALLRLADWLGAMADRIEQAGRDDGGDRP